MIKKNRNQTNKTTAIMLAILIALFSIISPLETYCYQTESINTTNIVEQLNNTVIDELNQINFNGLESIIVDFNKNNTNIFSINNIKNKVYSILSGESAVEYSSVLEAIFSSIIELVKKYVPLLSIIVTLGVLSNLLNGFKSKFGEKSIGDLIHLICFMSVVIIMITVINNLSTTTGRSISSMVGQINQIFPILLTLMVGIGATSSVSVFQPIVGIISTYVADIFNYFIMPLFLFNFVFHIISNLTSNVKLDKFAEFTSSLFKWSVGITFTIFFAIFTIQGISAGSFDSVSIRTAKYSIKSYVPILGGYLSDGMDLILSSSVLIKNSIGLVGVLLIMSTIISPILEIVICSLLLKLVSAILQPLGDGKTCNFLTSSSKSIIMLSTTVIAVGFMYLISIGLVMTTSNVVL